MSKNDRSSYDIGHMETLADMDSPVHRLDPRSKVLTTFVFIVLVVSIDKYEVSLLLPFFLYPIVLITLSRLPFTYFLKKFLLLSPFILLIAIFNPLLDREILIKIGPCALSGGWVSFVSIMLRFTLTAGSALILITTTSFPAVCMALEKLGTPNIFAVQLLLLYRYIFVLVGEGGRMFRAYSLRSFKKSGLGLTIFKQLIGNLLLRSLDRSQRIHMAMLCRGFEGQIRVVRQSRFGVAETFFTFFSCAIFVFLRFYNIPQLVGKLMMEISR